MVETIQINLCYQTVLLLIFDQVVGCEGLMAGEFLGFKKKAARARCDSPLGEPALQMT